MAGAQAVLSRINAGEPFEQLAQELSQDPGSAAQGGDLGFFGRGLMDMAFEDAAYQLKVGEISAAVKSEYGYHIIKLEEIRGGESKSFADVKSEILAELQQERAEQRFYDQAELLANLTYEQPDTLNAAAEQLNLQIQKSPLFGQGGGEGIAKNSKFAQVAFNEDVLQRGNNSEVIEISRNHLAVLRLDEHQPEGIQPLERVKAAIEKQLLKEKAEEQALLFTESLLERVRSGTTVESVAKSEQLEWKQATIQRDATDLERAIVSAAFKMAHPHSGEENRQLLRLANGDQVIVALTAVESNMTADTVVGAQESKSLREAYAATAYNSVVAQLRSQADIEIKP
jgi:peptidyl-prolyl cis-trans isomerase D